MDVSLVPYSIIYRISISLTPLLFSETLLISEASIFIFNLYSYLTVCTINYVFLGFCRMFPLPCWFVFLGSTVQSGLTMELTLTLQHVLKLAPMQFLVQDLVVSLVARSSYLLPILWNMRRWQISYPLEQVSIFFFLPSIISPDLNINF